MAVASFASLSSSPPFLYRPSLPPQFRSLNPGRDEFCVYRNCSWRRAVVIPLKCLSTGPGQDDEAETETTSLPSSSSSSSSSSSATETEVESLSLLSSSCTFSGNSAYKWCAGLGGLGFVETAYLSYLKLTNSDAFCPIGGGTCGDILNSDYAVVFGVPLPLIGMVGYGLVGCIGLQLAAKNLPFGITESNARLGLLGTTTSIAAASAYFLYILSSRFPSATCSYCLVSALLSFSLFFITLMELGLQELQKLVGLQLCIASLVIAALNTSYSSSQPVPTSLAEIDLPYIATEVSTPSSPLAISLAKHLHSIGAKMYGAFWCSHCLEQKEMFGHEAAKILDYVECFPEGYHKGTKMVKACTDVRIEGFPTWVINGEVISGEKELLELAEISGLETDKLS